jgi:protein transport protein SEC13
VLEAELEGHQDWVRDVAWSPVQAHDSYTIASCGLDGRVVIWRTDNLEGKQWRENVIRQGDEPVYNVSWSPNGAVLAVASADNKVSLYQERIQDEWVQISDPSTTNISAD